MAGPGEQAEVRGRDARGRTGRAGDDHVAARVAFDAADAAPAKVQFDGRSESGAAVRTQWLEEGGQIGQRHDQRPCAVGWRDVRRAKRQVGRGAAARGHAEALDVEAGAIGVLWIGALRAAVPQAIVVGSLPVKIVVIPFHQILLQVIVAAEKPEHRVRAGAGEIRGEQPSSIGPGLGIVGVRLRTHPVDAIADACRSLDVHLLRRAVGVEIGEAEEGIHIHGLDRPAGLDAAVNADGLVFIVTDHHPVRIEGHGRRGIADPGVPDGVGTTHRRRGVVEDATPDERTVVDGNDDVAVADARRVDGQPPGAAADAGGREIGVGHHCLIRAGDGHDECSGGNFFVLHGEGDRGGSWITDNTGEGFQFADAWRRIVGRTRAQRGAQGEIRADVHVVVSEGISGRAREVARDPGDGRARRVVRAQARGGVRREVSLGQVHAAVNLIAVTAVRPADGVEYDAAVGQALQLSVVSGVEIRFSEDWCRASD